ncbi:MAG: GH3 auxin-responsive promoter [Rhodothermales bacterium]|nr:GH3 auxin-responsive promoter [Rhodothermales bacterium]
MSRFIGSIIRAIPGTSLHAIRQFSADPVGVQNRLLISMLKRAADTEWGRRYNFNQISRSEDAVSTYLDAVPIHSYDDYEEDVRRIREGHPDIIWPGRFYDFAVSSGTVSKGKIIPISPETMKKNMRFSLGSAINYSATSGQAGFWFGRFLSLPGQMHPDEKYPGNFIGEVSGLQARYAPTIIAKYYQAVPNDILFIGNWEKKLDAVVEHVAKMDIRAIATVPTWAMILFTRLIDHVNDKGDRKVNSIAEIWPNLQTIFTGGVALSSYRRVLMDQIGKPSVALLETYGASEGYFSFQDDPDRPDMLLHLDNGVHYQFVRMDEFNKPGARRYTIGEVETDIRYALYVSTVSGLWSFPVHDVVKFTQLYPHRIVVAGRTSEMIDKYGEAVFADEARKTLEYACAKFGYAVVDYHVAPSPPDVDRMPAHQWLVEFDTPPADLDTMSSVMDEYLQEINRHYMIRREAQAFGPPQIVSLPPGTYFKWLKKTKTRVSAQSKVPRMSEERQIADSVLETAGIAAS